MPDTISKPNQSPKIVWSDSNQQFPLWSPNRQDNPQMIERLREVELEIREKEYLRLLYVAMTRAEDRLYIGGWGTLPKDEDSTWYGKLKNRLKPIAREANGVLQISSDQVSVPDKKDIRPKIKKDALQLPEWVWQAPKELTFETDRLIPSAPNQISNNLSLFAPEKTDKFLRGRIIHSLLHILPNIPAEKRWNLAKKYLLDEYPKLDKEQKDECITTALKVINSPCLREIFSENAFVEAPLNGTVKENGIDREVMARVDRLVVLDKEVIIADFKTDKRPPKKFDDIEETYKNQMNIYYKLIKKIYPKHVIRPMLIWTEGPIRIDFPEKYLSHS
jgi:ATP-dependent helicase/nuclease subunit A